MFSLRRPPYKYDQLGPAGRRLARVPRYARLIALLPPERFGRLVSEAATFWEAYTFVAYPFNEETGLLDDGLKARLAQNLGWHLPGDAPRTELLVRHWQVELARDFLAAIAFEMFLGESGDGSQLPIFRVECDLREFLNRAFNRLENSGAYCSLRGNPIPGDYLWVDWTRLKAMDSHGLKHMVFSATDELLQFTDTTTQTFFAAYWACRWSSESEREILRTWLPDPLERTNEEYLELWRFAAEMPKEACGDGARYEALFSPLYDRSWTDEKGLPIRSTELIYRTWDRMCNTRAGETFGGEFEKIRRDRKDHERRAVARGLFVEDAGESHFLSLCEGKRGEKDTGRFLMGAPDGEDAFWDGKGEERNNPQHRVRLSPYRLHRFCVSNAEYELFDRRRRTSRAFWDTVKDLSRHPVVDVSWYDAWCFARWLGEIEVDGARYRLELPTEAEWEYACRAGSTTAYCFGNSASQLGKYAGFDGNYGGRTHSMGGKRPNAWGFYDMHGNVWEWCSDWYEWDFYRRHAEEVENPLAPVTALARVRVMRGGGWCNFGWACRSAYRGMYAPGDRNWDDGFRLAAVPRSREVRR